MTSTPVSGVVGPEQPEGPPELTPAQRTKSLIAINLTAILAGIAMGAAMPMISMAMEVRHQDAVAIGYVVAAAPLALLVSSPFVGAVVNRFGLLGSILGGTTLTAVAFALMPTFFGPVPWFALRFIGGIGVAVVWILGETWINAMATTDNRGRVVAVYMVLLSAGFAVGPLLAQWMGIESWTPFYVAAVLIGASALPLVIAREVAPRLPEAPKHAFARSFRIAPLVMTVAFLTGAIDSAQVSFMPVYGVRMGIDPDLALTMLVVLVAGSSLAQIPVGWLADKMDRRSLMIWCMAICCIFSAVLPSVLHDPVLIWPVLVVWGGTAFALYSISLVLLGDRFGPAELAGANAAFVSMFELGSVGGPVTVGYAMDIWGPNGMPVVLVAVCMPVFVLAYVRRLQRRKMKQETTGASEGVQS